MNDFVFEKDQTPMTRIKVIGVGGGGCNAVESMFDLDLPGVEFYAVNTDSQALSHSRSPNRIQIGREITAGMGAGGDPALGEQAAVADRDLLHGMIEGADMVFLAACLGGGTGTGATPVIAELARSLNVLTVALVTKPFQFEGPQRKVRAQQGIERLRDYVDALIVIMNDKLLETVGTKTPLLEAFGHVNSILAQGVQSISDLISMPGLINADFQDVRAVMGETGGAVLGIGLGKGENRATEAVKKACSATLQEKIVIDGARRVLISVTGGPDLTLHEVNEAASLVYEAADPEANIIFSAVINEKMSDEIRVTIIATGFGEETTKFAAPSLGARERPATGLASQTAAATSVLSPRAEAYARKVETRRNESPPASEPRAPVETAASSPPAPAIKRPEPRSLFQETDFHGGIPASWRDDPAEESEGDGVSDETNEVEESGAGAVAHELASELTAGHEEPDAEENFEIPAIIRRRKSFFS